MLTRDEQWILAGLTSEETREFRALDQDLPFAGEVVWPQGGFPGNPGAEQRWLELWSKHRRAMTGQLAEGGAPMLWW